MRGSILYYCAPVGGLATYLALLQLFGEELAAPMAWANSLTAITSLCIIAILYLQPDTRTGLLSRWGSAIPALIIIGCIIYAEATKTKNYIGPTLTISILCRLSFIAIQKNDEMRTLTISILSAILTPLSSTPALASEPLNRFLLALIIPAALTLIWLRFFRIKIPKTCTIEATAPSLLPLARSLLVQLPLILFPIMEPRIISLVTPESAAEYMMQWKIIYGAAVLLYTKVQFKLAFQTMDAKHLRRHGWAALTILFMVISFTTIDASWAQIARLFLTAVFVNEVALITRGSLRHHPSLATAIITTAFFALIVGLIHLNTPMHFNPPSSSSALVYYPLIICLSISGSLLSLLKLNPPKTTPS